ncbi:hypothetical protein FZEAL_1568 [Fusarium zealandicum]|uniref:J domain-containing protein n=1 Tax=Fusarium zealandicum TaxID=1053134 RepID=A0A8H4USG5_9HYPO|nr:hypothetical protein FZEAL_1568 [Fusarium zealandicum]
MSSYLSMLGWAFLPSLATGWIQSIYYGLTIRAGERKPAPGSARFKSHRRIIHILVVAAYLLYTIFEADYEQRSISSYYADLGVALDATDREVKSRFRRLAAMHHPDKAGGNDSAAFFMHLKLASDTLQDAAKRFAYERFGPDIAHWQKCLTIKDYITRGVISGILPHYVVAAASVYVLGLFGYMDFGEYYRWLILITLCTFELHAVTRPDFPLFIDAVNSVIMRVSSLPPYLPFQVISLARRLTITIYIALSQIGPLLAVQFGGPQKSEEDADKTLHQSLSRLETLAKQLDGDAMRLLDMEMAPYRGDAEATSNLQGKMKEWLVQNTIRADPMVRDAMGTSLRKRRVDAPAGAKGNR